MLQRSQGRKRRLLERYESAGHWGQPVAWQWFWAFLSQLIWYLNVPKFRYLGGSIYVSVYIMACSNKLGKPKWRLFQICVILTVYFGDFIREFRGKSLTSCPFLVDSVVFSVWVHVPVVFSIILCHPYPEDNVTTGSPSLWSTEEPCQHRGSFVPRASCVETLVHPYFWGSKSNQGSG